MNRPHHHRGLLYRSQALTFVCVMVVLCGATNSCKQPPPPAPALRTTTPAEPSVQTQTPAVVVPSCGTRTRTHAARASASSAMVLSPDEQLVAVADSDNDKIVLLSLQNGALTIVRSISTGPGPAHVLFDGTNTVYVTERRGNSVAAFAVPTGALRCRSSVAADPYALALSDNEQTLFVSSGLTHTITRFATDSLRATATVSVAREPRGIVLAQQSSRLFIAHAVGAPLSALDVQGTELQNHRLARLPTDLLNAALNGDGNAHDPSNAWAAVLDPTTGRIVVPFQSNRTGRLGTTAQGIHDLKDLALTVLPFVEPFGPLRRGNAPMGNGYGGGDGLAHLTVFALAVFDTANDRWAYAFGDEPYVTPDGVGVGSTRTPTAIRIPTAATIAADGRSVFVVSTGTDALAQVRFPNPGSDGRIRYANTQQVPRFNRTLNAPIAVVRTRENQLLVYSQLEHAVEFGPATARQRISTGGETLSPTLARGRRLFYNGNNRRIARDGFTCAHCHPDGREDALQWHFGDGLRQTIFLAGRLHAPFGWNGRHAQLVDNLRETTHRLGREGELSDEDFAALAAYLTEGLVVPALPVPERTTSVEAGERVFHRIGCNSCHRSNDHFVDHSPHVLTQGSFDTPSLHLVRYTAPYFHDGRFETLEEMLADRNHGMGVTHTLSEDDRNALVSYLEAL